MLVRLVCPRVRLARTLEVLRPLGVTQALLAVADVGPMVDVRFGTRTVRMCLGDLPLPGTPYPHLTLIRQSDVEDVLARALADRGVTVEHGTELVGLHERADSVRAVLRSEQLQPTTPGLLFLFPCGEQATWRHELTDLPGLGLMAIRPDGHVGLRCRADDVRQLSDWLTDVGAVGAASLPVRPWPAGSPPC